jgi:ParB/Sulfiredoxin domain
MTTDIEIRNIAPLHCIRDREKYEQLADAMRETGWVGRPLLVLQVGEYYQAATGSHRVRAAERAGFEEVPCVVIDAEAFYGAGYGESDLWDDDVTLCILREIGDTEAAAVMQAEIEANNQ